MKASHLSLRHVHLCAVFALAAFGGEAVMAQTVKLDANCVPQISRQQERLYQKANDGIDALRQFIFIRRAILQVDVYETASWAESLNAARGACAKKRASAVDAAQKASS